MSGYGRLRRKQLGLELGILRDIFNDAWSGNWEFVPFTKAEFTDIGELLTLLVDGDFVQIAEIDGRPVAMVVALPNILRRGIKSGEMSWILEDNVGMRSILETIGGKAYKRYRICEKDL